MKMACQMRLNTRPRRIFAIVWAWFEIFLFAGVFFGWGSLVFMLKEDGVYQDLCTSKQLVQDGLHGPAVVNYNASDFNASTLPVQIIDKTEVVVDCSEQDKVYSLGFSLASGLWPFAYGIVGQLGHKFGTRFIRLTCILFFIIGSLLIAFATAATPWIAFVGECMYGVSGCGLLFTNMQLSYLFKRGRTIVCGMMTGAFDSSIATVLYIKLAYDDGISRQACYIFIACAHVITLISTFVWLPKMYIDDPESTKEVQVATSEPRLVNKLLEATRTNLEDPTGLGSCLSLDGSTFHIHVPKPNFHGSQILSDHDVDVTLQQTVDRVEMESDPTTLRGHLCSSSFLLHIVWYSFLQLRFVYFVGSLNPWIESVSESPEEVSRFTNVSMYCMMAGIITSITAGTFFDCQKQYFKNSKCLVRRQLAPLVLPLTAGTVLGIAVSILQMIPSKIAVYAAFITLTAFRSFLYAIGNGYLSVMFPSKYFSSLAGLLMVLTGSFTFLQYALFSWDTSYPKAGFHVNIFLLCMVILSSIHPLYQFMQCRSRNNNNNSKQYGIKPVQMQNHC